MYGGALEMDVPNSLASHTTDTETNAIQAGVVSVEPGDCWRNVTLNDMPVVPMAVAKARHNALKQDQGAGMPPLIESQLVFPNPSGNKCGGVRGWAIPLHGVLTLDFVAGTSSQDGESVATESDIASLLDDISQPHIDGRASAVQQLLIEGRSVHSRFSNLNLWIGMVHAT